ncbi:beta-glucanase precursor [Bacillus sp. JCM 19046]|nr:beta-glucanase precursor [Bacillus sp. JCM 19046]
MGNGQPNLPGWGNEELQYYSDDPKNVRVENGELIIEAHQESVSDEFGTYGYTSGKVLTEGRFSQTYGRFEARMRLPAGQGFWPAFWMMPEDDQYGGWAASGEIDIMENAGATPNKIGGAIHYGGLGRKTNSRREIITSLLGQMRRTTTNTRLSGSQEKYVGM